MLAKVKQEIERKEGERQGGRRRKKKIGGKRNQTLILTVS